MTAPSPAPPAAPTHTRIRTLLETIERCEREQKTFRIDELHQDKAVAHAEIGWLRAEGLALLQPIEGPTGPSLDAQLTPFGRGSLALVRGET